MKKRNVNLYSNKSKINLEITTDYPSLVVYTHNDDSPDNIDYYKLYPYAGVALECMYEPGGILTDFLNDGIIGANETYNHFISYKFTIK